MLLGPAGLLLGGLTGSKRTVEKLKRLSLKLYTNDLYRPITEIVFYSNMNGGDPDGFLEKASARTLDEWYGRFLTIAQSATQQQASPALPVTTPQ